MITDLKTSYDAEMCTSDVEKGQDEDVANTMPLDKEDTQGSNLNYYSKYLRDLRATLGVKYPDSFIWF